MARDIKYYLGKYLYKITLSEKYDPRNISVEKMED